MRVEDWLTDTQVERVSDLLYLISLARCGERITWPLTYLIHSYKLRNESAGLVYRDVGGKSIESLIPSQSWKVWRRTYMLSRLLFILTRFKNDRAGLVYRDPGGKSIGSPPCLAREWRMNYMLSSILVSCISIATHSCKA